MIIQRRIKPMAARRGIRSGSGKEPVVWAYTIYGGTAAYRMVKMMPKVETGYHRTACFFDIPSV
jgi:hypothetical protein